MDEKYNMHDTAPGPQPGAGLGDLGDDGGVQPHQQHTGAGHPHGLQFPGHRGGLGVGGGAPVDGPVAPAQQVHHQPDGRTVRPGAGHPHHIVQKNAVPAAEPVQPRHRQRVVRHQVDRIHLFVQQDLPAFVKRIAPQRPGRQVQHLDAGGRGLGLDGMGPHGRVQNQDTAAQLRKSTGQAHLLPVIGAPLAGCAAVQAGDCNGTHGFPPFGCQRGRARQRMPSTSSCPSRQ